MSVGWNIIKSNLMILVKVFFLKGDLSPLLQYFKCGSKGVILLWMPYETI
jgi:hypothetical protein